MKAFRLIEKDLLSDSHFPVRVVFNAISDSRFLRVLEGISNGRGFGENFGACVFPDDLDEQDIEEGGTLVGVEFGLHNGEEIVLDYQTFYYYLRKVCDVFFQEHSDEKNTVTYLLKKFRERYNIDN